jgi:hypothetical protein
LQLGRIPVWTVAITLLLGGAAAVAALNESKVDVVWIAGWPDASAVSSLLRNPKVRLMSFPMADAFTRVFPELVRLLLPQGVIDLDSITPLNDVVLVGTTVKVLVRNDLHPQIVQVLLQAMVEAHAKLKALEASFDINANAISLPETKIEIERIEDAVSHIRFPLRALP